MTKTKTKTDKDAEAREDLLRILKPGDRVYCILRHVSQSGMTQVIDLYANDPESGMVPIGGSAATLMGYTYTAKYGGGIKIGGCGMDMGFALVYGLSRRLFRDVPAQEGCTYPDDCGYWLKHTWL